jgi:cation transport regulator
MPYGRKSELPYRVKENLPSHAEEIYQKAYNSAWEQYKDPSKRRGNETREEVSHKVAWNAVKKVYKKEGDKWVKKENK